MKLTHILGPWINRNVPDCEIKGIKNDSRQVQPGDLFLAYPGAVADGRHFIEKAVAAGAVAIAYDPTNLLSPIIFSTLIPCIPVPNLAEELSKIAQRFYGNPSKSLNVTGVTGTNGKTTIAYQLAQAHQLLGQSSSYIGTIGQGEVTSIKPLENTTPDALCLQKLFFEYQNRGIKQVCMEVSSHALSQHRVEGIEFNQAIFTNLTLDHLDYHQTMEAYGAAKALLFQGEQLEWAIINQDDSYQELINKAVKANTKKISYGLHDNSDVRALNWRIDIRGTEIEILSPWGTQQLNIKAIGTFNIYNSLAIFSSLLAFGYSIDQVATVMSQLKPAPGRMEIVAQAPYVLVDYAHTPDALENALSTLKQLKKGKLWVIFGCGGDRDKTKRPIMGKAASLYADKIIITSDNPRTENPHEIIEEIAIGIDRSADVIQLVNREEAITYALNAAEQEDIILIAGKGHEAYQQIGTVKHAFSDQDIVRRLRATI